MSDLALPDPDLRALATGEVVVGFAARGTVEVGDEVGLAAAGARAPADLKPAYRHWSDAGPPEGNWTAIVEAVHPAALLDGAAGTARHILAAVPEGDLVVLRVYGPGGPVLSDVAYAARRRSLDGAW